MSKSQTTPGKFEKVEECLYRYSSNGTYYARMDVKGKEVRRSLKTKDRDLAKRRLRAMKDDIEKLDVSAARTTLEQWMQTFEGLYGGKAQGTLYKVAAAMKAMRALWPGGVHWRMSEIKVSEVHEWLPTQEAYLAHSSRNDRAQFLKKLFELAVDNGIIVESPAKKVKMLRRDTPIRNTPNMEQFQAIAAEIRASTRNHFREPSGDFAEFLGLSGIGNSEAANLTWGTSTSRGEDPGAAQQDSDGLRGADLSPARAPAQATQGRRGAPSIRARVFGGRNQKGAYQSLCSAKLCPLYAAVVAKVLHHPGGGTGD